MRDETRKSLDAWLKELEQRTSGGVGMTTGEIAVALGWTNGPTGRKRVIERILRPAKIAGRLATLPILREAIDGRKQMLTGYVIKPPPKRK